LELDGDRSAISAAPDAGELQSDIPFLFVFDSSSVEQLGVVHSSALSLLVLQQGFVWLGRQQQVCSSKEVG
jgi:hypothetical protein